MAAISFLLTYVAIAAAVVSWIASIYYFWKMQMQLGAEQSHLRFMTFVAWPFAFGRLAGAARESASKVNKAIVAFFLSLFVAIGAWGATFIFAATGR